MLKLLAAFISADASSRESLKSQINEIVKTDDGNANVKLLTAIMCIHDDSIKDAIVHLSNESNLEQ